MGGKNSSLSSKGSAASRFIPREPMQEKFDIPEVEPWYPPPRLPTTPKKDVYHPEENRDIFLHALEAPDNLEDSWDELVEYLTSIYRTDMMKVRSIFSWLGLQDIDYEDFAAVEKVEELEQITPRGYMNLIKKRKGSYASFLALLCRTAGIPCVIIKGISKALGYEVGMKDVDHLRDCWTAVYVSGWRLIHPLWAFKAKVGSKSGTWVPIEATIELQEIDAESDDGVNVDFNEYFFLVEPTELVNVCLPDNPEWQLCSQITTFDKWISVPHFMKKYYLEDIKLVSEYAKPLTATNGVCGVVVKTPERTKDEYQLSYDLFFSIVSSKPEVDIEEPVFLKRYVIMSRNCRDGKWYFEVRFPVEGLYRLTLYGGPNTQRSLPCLCDIAISCKTPWPDLTPYPASPDIGFGPVGKTKKMGLLDPSHASGMLHMKARQTFYVTFKPDRHLLARAKLLGAKGKELKDHVKCTLNNQSSLHLLVIAVDLPSEGEYALIISSRPRDSAMAKWANVCNYYITTDPPRVKGAAETYRNVQPAFDMNTRAASEDAEKTNDADGSLEKATLKLEYQERQKELQDAINRQNIDMLNSAIQKAEKSTHANKLRGILERAREERDKLLSTDKFLHDVLEMKQSTLTEMVSYTKPAMVIHDVLKAMLLLLGERPEKVLDWIGIQKGMRKTGKDGVFRRIRAFEIGNVPDETLRRVRYILETYEEMDVRSASAGAATFYIWVKNEVDRGGESKC